MSCNTDDSNVFERRLTTNIPFGIDLVDWLADLGDSLQGGAAAVSAVSDGVGLIADGLGAVAFIQGTWVLCRPSGGDPIGINSVTFTVTTRDANSDTFTIYFNIVN